MDPHRPIRSNGGFTLLEMLVSIAIIGLVLVSIFKMQSGTTRLAAAGDFYSTASHLAEMKLSDISVGLIAGSRDEDESGDFGDHFSEYQWRYTLSHLDLSDASLIQNSDELEAVQLFLGKDVITRLIKIDLEITHSFGLSLHFNTWRFVQNDEI